jgi:lipopolysaccharide heptosyltransferase I
LIIKPSAIGDVVHALPVLPRLKRLWPNAKLSWLITPACAKLVERHPLVDEVILFERRKWARGWYNPSALWDVALFVHELRRRRFDLVIDLQGLLRSGLTTLLSGAPRRVGFSNARELAPAFYNERIDCSWAKEHAVTRYLKIASALGCADGPVEFVFGVDDEDRKYIQSLIPAETEYAVLLPGTNWDTKRWPVARYAGLAKLIKERFGLETVTAGASVDKKLAAEIASTFDLTGKTSLRQIVALLERAKLVVGNDTGPLHIAAGMGVPLVALYGPTDPVRTGPYGREESVLQIGLPCRPCYSRTCSHRSCMEWIKIESVLELGKQQIANKFKEHPSNC